jgi:hypothetical protein
MEVVLVALEAAIVAAGSRHADPRVLFFSPRRQLLEGIGLFLLGCVSYVGARLLAPSAVAENRGARPLDSWVLSPAEQAWRLLMAANLTAVVLYKVLRGPDQFWYFLQPCHLVTFLFLVSLHLPSYRAASRVFHATLPCTFVTILAMLFPDLGNLRLPLEIPCFWLHHWTILLYPLYQVAVGRFPHRGASRMRSLLSAYLLAMAGTCMVHVLLHWPLGLLSGVNLEYTLWPPPSIPTLPLSCSAHNFRICCCGAFYVLAAVFGILVPLILAPLARASAAGKKA